MRTEISRRAALKSLGATGVVLAGGATIISAQSDEASSDVDELELVYEFEPPEGSPQEPPFGQLPENVAASPWGAKYVSVPTQAQIWKFGSDDEPVDPPFVQFDSTEEFLVGPTGLEYDPNGRLYSAFVSDLSSSEDAETNGVYEIDDDGEYELYAEISSGVEDFPSFPNDITLLEHSLLVTDSFSGVIWEVKKGRTEVWAGELWDGDPDDFPSGPLVPPAPTAGGPQFGPNGLQFTENKDTLYVANSGKGTIVEIPVDSFGNPGEPEVFVDGLVAPDGLAMDVDENLYVADNGANQILRISPDGDVEVLAENEMEGGAETTTTSANETTTTTNATTTANETTTTEVETTTANETTTEEETTTTTNATTTEGETTTAANETTTTANETTTADGETTTEPASQESPPILDQPADVTFGAADGQRETVFVVNLALTSQFEEPTPSLIKFDVGIEGLRVER
ncbi:SMP-30/gluconolactonase/LRE family protein [Haloferax sp. YSMS24]|uniref:SMP-30/gluconolactonase/LRE family protein n=1 Tax=Haloferax sp. YSMS24 TaxID=3388425 RepID=UPI00398CBAC1